MGKQAAGIDTMTLAQWLTLFAYIAAAVVVVIVLRDGKDSL